MKRGLFLVTTLTLACTLHAQGALTPQEAHTVFATYNPALLQKAAQNPTLNQLVNTLLQRYLTRNPADTLANRYTLIALARNFENSLALSQTLSQYEQALVYSRQGGQVQTVAREHARQILLAIYPRIWAVTIQTKEALLNAYRQQQSYAKTQEAKTQLTGAIQALQADLKNLKTDVGPQLVLLTQQALMQVEQQTEAQQAAQYAQHTAQVSNLQIKTNHKHPVAK